MVVYLVIHDDDPYNVGVFSSKKKAFDAIPGEYTIEESSYSPGVCWVTESTTECDGSGS